MKMELEVVTFPWKWLGTKVPKKGHCDAQPKNIEKCQDYKENDDTLNLENWL